MLTSLLLGIIPGLIAGAIFGERVGVVVMLLVAGVVYFGLVVCPSCGKSTRPFYPVCPHCTHRKWAPGKGPFGT